MTEQGRAITPCPGCGGDETKHWPGCPTLDDAAVETEIRRLIGAADDLERQEATEPRTTTDKPRLLVVVHPDRYDDVQRAVTRLGHGDVLVQQNRWVPDPSQAYVMKPPTDEAILDRRWGRDL